MLASRRGESDLVYHRGVFYLLAVCDVPEPDEQTVDGVLGVDLGIANLATDWTASGTVDGVSNANAVGIPMCGNACNNRPVRSREWLIGWSRRMGAAAGRSD